MTNDAEVLAPFVSGRLGATDKCRHCGAWIAWAVTTSGSRMPLDPLPDHVGNIAVTWDDHDGYRSYVRGPLDVVKGDRYVTHFASSPVCAAVFRGRRRGR